MTYHYPQGNAYDVIQRDVESSFHKAIDKEPEDIKNIVIVGAYHGYEIQRLLSNYTNVIIHAFEAVPEHFDVLKQNYGSNSRVKLYNKAVSDSDGFVEFYELGNGGEGSGSLLKFQGDKHGHPFQIKSVLNLPCVTLNSLFSESGIDLLWVDVQGAELSVLKGSPLKNCNSLFLEIYTKDFIKPWDAEPYQGQCYKEDLEDYLEDFDLHSIGLDNEHGNGQGNSFWIKK